MNSLRPQHRFLAEQWRRKGWLSQMLRPLSALTSWAVLRKREHYRSGQRAAYRPPVPVVVIGNIYVGGTGKTPMVIATVQALQARGWTPGIVSRGYGVKIGPQPRTGRGLLAAAQFGDEPALIASATGAPIAVHPRRALAAQALLHAHPDIDVIVSDDGLQHLALARDLEIIVQDERGTGNGCLLPGGPLREPASRLQEVQAVITTLGRRPDPVQPPDVSATATRRIDMWLEPAAARNLQTGQHLPLNTFADRHRYPQVVGVAGIGNPERFFTTLRAAGITLASSLALPDHHDYRHSPFAALQADAILITSKDAIKCTAIDDPRLWEVPVSAQFSDPTLFDWMAARLRAAIVDQSKH